MTEKKRLDAVVLELNGAESREKAQALIMSGCVFVNGQKADKSGMQIRPDDKVEIRGAALKYVSRGGLKLEKAMSVYGISLDGMICADIGASTGGFTDCMLMNGAEKVYAIDVGYGQLAWKLRCDERVINLERTNFRYVTKEQIPDPLDFASVDVSFISLKIILPVLRNLLKDDASCVCLIKPQFEAGKGKVGKNGVVRDPEVHIEVVEGITSFMLECGFSVVGLDYSPIKGPKGNIEYLAYIKFSDEPQYLADAAPREVVERSHTNLDIKEE
ncbi:MAG: TlyA family RNA methyltransferase [Clostridia bacterium]|nr:TlyA family RNA methyltransferase [Clostridia bacterium]